MRRSPSSEQLEVKNRCGQVLALTAPGNPASLLHSRYGDRSDSDMLAATVTPLRLMDFLVRSEGLEPPRFYSLPPQGSASTNSATSAWKTGTGLTPDRINGADVTNQRWGDKARRRASSDAGKTGEFGTLSASIESKRGSRFLIRRVFSTRTGFHFA